MNRTAATGPRTLLDALIAAFDDTLRTPEGVLPPAAILWPDPEGQWREVVARLRSTSPRVYTLGTYDPATLTGPAIWLRCIVDRTLPEHSPPQGAVPVFYLPQVPLQDLRAAEVCPPALQPLLELQYRGKVWHAPNGREWTAEGFLTTDAGLKLDVARDVATRAALLRSLPLLTDVDLSHLRGRRLDSADFDKLAVDDPVRDLLRWMNDADGTRSALGDVRWPALRSMSRDQFGFDPEDGSPADAATHVVRGGAPWDGVWARFCENPRLYPGIPKLLRQPEVGGGELALDMSRRPIENDDAELRLQKALEQASTMPHHEACQAVLELDQEHGPRRGWVWAEIGESPLAMVLEPLAELAVAAQVPLGGTGISGVIEEYVASGWECDAAAVEALAAQLGAANVKAVHGAVRALYLPWLDATARRFQELAAAAPTELAKMATSPEAKRDICILFVDGLRMDAGQRLARLFEDRQLNVTRQHRIAPLPTVTPTAKPLASPVAEQVAGPDGTDDFCAVLASDEKPITAQRLRDVMAAAGIEVMAPDETRVPTGAKGGWTEGGQLDELGHKLQVRLASQLPQELERLADRVSGLLDAGWKAVRVVTDHGWMLMPGGLPKVDLPKFLTETRWARCAVVKGDSTTEMPVFPWHWNQQIRIATPPGAAAFLAGNDYAHGGVSPQEVVIPDLLVERGAPEAKPMIAEVQWTRLRCRVTVQDAPAGGHVDVRTKWKEPDSSIVASAKAPDGEGQVSLVVADDKHEGSAAFVVLLDAAGAVVDRKNTTVGDA